MEEYSCLSISREEFREIYDGLAILEHEYIFYTKPINEQDLNKNYLTSKLWRLNNLYTIVDKWSNRRIFCMNRAQHIVYAASLKHPRLIILKSRQQGISTLWLVSFFDDGLTLRDTTIGLMAQGLDESEALLERIKLLWDELHPSIKNYLNLNIKVNNSKEFSLHNGSKIFVRTSFRSTTLQRLHISEMGKIANKNPEKAKETKTGTLQALARGNIGVVESTAEGDNMFKEMWDNAVLYSGDLASKDFYPVFLSWLDDPDCIEDKEQVLNYKQQEYFDNLEKSLKRKISQKQKNFWIVQYRELGERIYQEYPATASEAFMATKEGTYWAKLYFENVVQQNREVSNLYDKNLDVEIAVDLGMNDTNVILPFQCYTDGFRVISEFADNGQRIKYYTDWIKKQPWFSNVTRVILPHDARVTELTSGKTREEVFDYELNYDADGDYNHVEELSRVRNITIDVLERTSSVNEDIEQVRQIMDQLWVDKACEYIKECFVNYRKEWNERLERFRDTPLHDEYSNGAAAIRYMVVGASRTNTLRNVSNRNKSKTTAVTAHKLRYSSTGFDV